MAFLRYANASVVKPDIKFAGWEEIRGVSNPFVDRSASKIVFEGLNPQDYMLSHCTIIASVDSEASKVPLGKQIVDGFQINRKYADWLISPNTSKYINNNNDAWERKLLLSCFRTFIGGENYVEHIQIPEMSRGKIVDAAARDIGDSIYVDILVATNRQHRPLISAITSGQLQTLSMGCFVPGTPVTMADGTRLPIEEVAPGDMVLTHKGRAREVLNKQIRFGEWGMRRISVTGVSDPIEATDNHPFFVIRPAKVCACGCGASLSAKDPDPVRRMAKRFKPGHDKRILNPNGTYSMYEARERQTTLANIQSFKIEQVRADELVVGDYAIFPKLNTATVHDPGIARARLLGYFLAEGSFLKRKGDPVEVQFNFSLTEKDTFVVEVVRLLVEAFPGCKPWVQDREDRNTCTVHVSGRRVAYWFKALGGEYSHLKRLHPEVMQWSVASHVNLIGAWLNGDGHRRADGHSIGTTTSYNLSCQLHALSIRCGIPLWADCVFGGETVTVDEAVIGGVARRHEGTGKLAAFNLYFPQASTRILKDVCAKSPGEGVRKKERHLRALDDMVIFPISTIEKFAYEGWVHNMEVEEDNSYQVHGVATHNCQVEFTLCTKCGNVAYDETQLCPHIKYSKGNEWIDDLGNKRKIAELCGHISDEPGSVKFIEASWVANPAFTGAVLRNILSPEEIAEVGNKIQAAFAQGSRVADLNLFQKAAYQLHSGQYGDQGDSQEPAAPPAKKPEKNPFDQAVDDLASHLRDKAVEKVRGEMGKDEAKTLRDPNQNDTLIKSALQNPVWKEMAKAVIATVGDGARARKALLGLILLKTGGWDAVKASRALTGHEILALSRMVDLASKRTIMAGEGRIYRTVVAVGGTSKYRDESQYMAACRRVLGRDPTQDEKRVLLVKGHLFSFGA